MKSQLVIEIDHSKDTYRHWHEGDWNAVDLREYIEHEGVTGITVTHSELDD